MLNIFFYTVTYLLDKTLSQTTEHKTLPKITKAVMTKILDSTFDQKDFQMFVTVMTHAQTCKACSTLFFESMQVAKNHLDSELK